MKDELLARFGNIDIYLFDQLLKGTYDHCRKVVDIGCGGGRNLVYLMQNGFEVYGIDQDAQAIENLRDICAELAPGAAPENFRVAKAEELPFPDVFFDLVICSAVLHFARNHAQFDSMLQEAWRVLKPGGYFFARLASDIGLEKQVQDRGNGRFVLPDGTTRYLVTEALLLSHTRSLNGELHEPVKTTVVSNLRSMTTWCMRKKL